VYAEEKRRPISIVREVYDVSGADGRVAHRLAE
jgi:hypothetical protein